MKLAAAQLLARLLLPLAALAAAGCAERTTPPVAFDPDSIPEAYARSTAALMWPGTSRAFQVTPEGDLYNGAWKVQVRPAADGVGADRPRAIAFEERWLPVAHWRRRSGAVRWDFEALALPVPAPRDSGLFVTLEVRAANTGTARCEAQLDLALAPPDSFPVFAAFDAPETPSPSLRWGSGWSADTVYGWCAERAAGGVLTQRFPLGPGETARVRVVLPAYPTPARALSRWARVPHAQRAAECRRFWAREVGRGARFELGDPEVERALRAAAVVLLSCRERRGPLRVPIGGPFQYRDIWLRDGARMTAALSVLGYTREAAELAAGLAEYEWPNGAFLSQRGQLDGTGQALWAFEQALLRPAPADSLARFAAAAKRAWGWCEWQREVGRRTGWPFGAMLPFGEPHDNELVRAQLVGNDAWAIAGYRAAARLLRAVGRVVEADSVEVSRRRYLDDFAQALARSGSRDVPPSWQGVGRDWGNLTVAWPCGALPVSSPNVAALARRVWAVAGGAGLGTYGEPDSLQYYVAADLGTWALLAGRRAQADSVLAALLHWRTASGAAGEIFSRSSRDFGRNLPPHATAAAALAALVRNALLFDDGDTLQLTLGAREAWWRGSRVSGAPTRWGRLDLSFRRDRDEAEWTWTPVPVWTGLSLPPGTRLAGEPGAGLEAGPGGGVILAPPGTRQARVRLAAEETGR